MHVLQTDIPRRSNCCQKCNNAFRPNDLYFSMLFKTCRQDFCQSCWNDFDRSNCLCYWKASVPIRKCSINPPLSKQDRYLSLLKGAIEHNSDEAYLLALYLVRKKVLLSRKEYLQGADIFSLFEIASTEEMLTIKKASLSDGNLEALTSGLALKLGDLKAS